MRLQMKKIFAIILTLLIAWPLMLKVFVFTSWQINKDFIAKNNCIERNNTASDCKGKCQLIKQLKETEPTEKPFTPPTGVEKVELSSFTEINSTSIVKTEDSSIILFKQDDTLVPFGIINSFFHPPEPLV